MTDLVVDAGVGIVYGVRTLHAATLGTIELGYVGQTRQRLRQRETQHRDEQPWSDIIVGSAYIISEGVWTDGELNEVELWAIRLLTPRYNVSSNHGNLQRTLPVVALQERHARDRQRGVPLWTAAPPPTWFSRPTRSPNAAPTASAPAPRGVHDGHRKILEALKAELCKPTPIAEATGYSVRRVHQLLDELIEFGEAERIINPGGPQKHGEYRLVDCEARR